MPTPRIDLVSLWMLPDRAAKPGRSAADGTLFTYPLDFAFYSLHNPGMALTKRQRQVYDYIAEVVQKKGYSPSFEEIGDGSGLSSLATVHKHITNLEKKGLLRRDYTLTRPPHIPPPTPNPHLPI